jgi:hypothetical protein
MELSLEKLEERGARWANVISVLPGFYCAYAVWKQRHSGSMTSEVSTGFIVALIAFVLCIGIGGILNFARRGHGSKTANTAQGASFISESSLIPWQGFESEEAWKKAVAEQGRLVSLGHSVDGLLTPLQIEAFRLANEVQSFYAEVGPQPQYPEEIQDGTKEGIVAALEKFSDRLRPYRDRMEHGFELRFAERINRTIREFAVQGIKNSSIRIVEVGFPHLGAEGEAGLPSSLRMLAVQQIEETNSEARIP